MKLKKSKVNFKKVYFYNLINSTLQKILKIFGHIHSFFISFQKIFFLVTKKFYILNLKK